MLIFTKLVTTSSNFQSESAQVACFIFTANLQLHNDTQLFIILSIAKFIDRELLQWYPYKYYMYIKCEIIS